MIATISGSRVFKAAIIISQNLYLTLDWDDQLRNNRENLSATLIQHVENTLHSEESIWILLFTDTLEENGQVMVIVKLVDLNFPVDLELRSVLNCNWEISSIVEAAELRRCNWSHVESSSFRLLRSRLFLGLVKTNNLAA